MINELDIIDDEDTGDIIPILDDDNIMLSLVNEFSIQRNSLNVMIDDLEKIKGKINTLFPDSLDKRYIRFFEEKMKAMTSLFSTILDIKKEIMKGLKTEMELRKSLKKSEEEGDVMEGFDIRQMAEKMDRLQEEHNKQKNKRHKLRTKGEEYVKIDK